MKASPGIGEGHGRPTRLGPPEGPAGLGRPLSSPCQTVLNKWLRPLLGKTGPWLCVGLKERRDQKKDKSAKVLDNSAYATKSAERRPSLYVHSRLHEHSLNGLSKCGVFARMLPRPSCIRYFRESAQQTPKVGGPVICMSGSIQFPAIGL